MVEAEASPARKQPGGRRKAVKVVLASLLVAFFVVEVGYRFVAPDDLRPKLKKMMDEARTTGHPFLSFAGKPGFETPPGEKLQKSHDEYGLRGNRHAPAKPEGVYRIVCLGGSSTYGHTPTSDSKTWPARLESLLNDVGKEVKDGEPLGKGLQFQVINAGMSGYSTFESTANLAFRMLEWEPDLVIVYHTINDMRCALYDRAGPIRMDNSHWRAIWPRMIEAPGEKTLELSMSYLILRKGLTSYVDGVNELARYNIVDFDKDDTDPYLQENVPDTGFDNFERNLRSIQAIAKEFGAKVVFASQANDDRDIGAASREAQLAGMARMTGILRDVAAAKGLVFVDAKAKLEAKAAADGIDTVFTNEVHLTDHGANQLALIFAEAILLGGHGLLDD